MFAVPKSREKAWGDARCRLRRTIVHRQPSATEYGRHTWGRPNVPISCGRFGSQGRGYRSSTLQAREIPALNRPGNGLLINGSRKRHSKKGRGRPRINSGQEMASYRHGRRTYVDHIADNRDHAFPRGRYPCPSLRRTGAPALRNDHWHPETPSTVGATRSLP